jgi:Ca2+:H+ antiporter
MLKNLFALRNLLNWLLVLVPISIGLELMHAAPLYIFIASSLAIIPLAGWMGRATEHLAERLGEGIGGLLNATFGNAAELIIALMALRRGLFEVVKASITGSIIGNILLVLGLSLLAGGLKYQKQRFNTAAAMIGSTMLALSAIGLLMPAVFHYLVRNHPNVGEQNLSLEIAIVLFATYVLSLIFTLRTHSHLYVGEVQTEKEEAVGTHGWSRTRSLITLLVATGLVALMSEFLVGAVEATSQLLGLTEVFVGVIVVAVIGNAAEHSTAVLVAVKNKMDLSLNIAIGSSMQIALFVAPVLVLASYVMASRPMDLIFTPLEVITVAVSVAVVALIAQDGESNWLEGVLLLAVYAILGLTFYFLPAG